MTRNLTIALLGAAILAGAPATAHDQPRSRTVAYDDLDLGSAAGRGALASRLRAAVIEVCRADTAELALVTRACRKAAYREADFRYAQLLAQHRRQTAERFAARR